MSVESAHDHVRHSYWLETSGDDLAPRAALHGEEYADVAILGAGFSGLWTAYYLHQHAPELRLALVEAEIVGYGASGRNGGWCFAGFPLSLHELTRRYGAEVARKVECAMRETVAEIAGVCAREGIDAQMACGGALRLARGAHQLLTIQRAHETARGLGLDDGYELLDTGQTAERVRVAGAAGALFVRHAASIHPGRLVRGLAHVVERRGATIYERSPVTTYETSPPALVTGKGRLRAGTIVLAGEAYLTRLRPLRRSLLPLYSHIILTEPLEPAQWDAIGWRDRECISSNILSVDYLNKTADGRILFGGRGGPYHLGSRIEDRYDHPSEVRAQLHRHLVEWFPTLAGTQITHSWGGPVGMPRDWMPSVSFDRDTGIATARGYTGQGVATTNLAGRILANLIVGRDSPLLELPLAGHQSPNWPPEPLRWLGVRYVQRAFARLDHRAGRTGRAPSGRSPAERLGRH